MGWVWPATVAVGLVVLLAVPEVLERRLADPRPSRLPLWLRPRPDGLPPRRRGLAGAAAAAALVTWTGHLGWQALLVAPLTGLLVFWALGLVGTTDRGQRRREVLAGLAQACDLLGAAVDAGLPVRLAVPVVADAVGGPVGEALGAVAARVQLGVSEQTAWSELTEPGMEPLARELARSVSTGMGLGRLLRDLAADARRAAAAAAMVRARRVGVRSVLPLMLCDLPAFVLLGIVPVIGGVVASVIG